MIRYTLFLILTVTCLGFASDAAYAQWPAKRTTDTTSLHPDSTTRAILSHSSAGHIIWHDIKESVYDGGRYVTRPLHWNAKEWAIVGTVTGVALVMQYADDPLVRNFFQSHQGKVGNAVEQFGNNFYGNGYATGLTAITLYTVGISEDNNKLRVMGRHVFQSFVYAGITATVIKTLFGRDRPFNNSGPNIFHGFSLNNAWNSLPSGHVTVASALTETLAADIGNTYASIGLYTALGLTVFGRLYSDEHWLSDTFVGALIGTAAGYWVSQEEDHYDMKTNEPKPTSFLIEPTLGGLSLTYKF